MAATRENLRAVYDAELDALLEILGLRNALVTGRLRCAFSGDVITWDNLNALFPDSGMVKVVCSRPECVAALAEKMDSREG